MADEEKLIFSVELDQEAAKKGAAEMVAEISRLGTARSTLSKQLKELQKDENANADSIKKVSAQLAENRLKTQEATKQRNTYDRVLKANDNSLGALRTKNSLLRAELDKVDKSTVQGQKDFDRLTNAINKNQTVINKADEATKNYRGSVGNYAGAIKDAFGANQVLGSEVSQLTRLYTQLLKATKAQTASQSAFNVVSGNGTAKIGLMTKATNAFKIALASTGVLLLVAAIGSLIAMFKSSEEGQNRLNKIMKVGGVIIGNITDIFVRLGDVIFTALSNPRKTWEQLQESFKTGYEFIKKQVLDRFKGNFDILVGGIEFGVAKIQLAWAKLWGNDENIARAEARMKETQDRMVEGGKLIIESNNLVKESFNQIKGAVKGFADETRREIDLAKQAADLTAKTDKLERDLLVERTRIENEISELRLKAKKEDEFTNAQRLKFLDQANRLQDQLFAKQELAAANRLKVIQLENSFSASNKEALDKEAEAQAKLNDLSVARLNAQRTIESERQTAIRKIEADQKAEQKRQEEAAKQRLEDEQKSTLQRINNEKAIIEARLLVTKEGSDLYFTLQRALLAKERELTLQNQELTGEERLLVKAEFLAKEAELELKQEEQRFQRRQEAIEKDGLLLQLQLSRREILESEYLQKSFDLKSKAYQDEIAQLEENSIARLAKEIEFENYKAEQIKAIQEKQLEEKRRLLDAEIQMDLDKIQSLQKVASETAKFLGEQTKAGKIALTIQKTLALGEMVINLTKRKGAIFETGEKIKAIAPPATIPIGAAYIGIANGAAIAQNLRDIAEINGVKFSKGGIALSGGTIPTQGGMITGRPHGQGGVKFVFGGALGEADGQKGEAYIINTNHDPALKAAASAINQAGGGRAFFNNGGIAYSDGGQATRGLNGSNGITYEEALQLIQSQPVQVSVEEFNKVQKKVAQITQKANS